MDVVISNYIASLIQTAANPVSMGDLALATVHLIIMHCYFDHPDGRPLAICAGVTSLLYVYLALAHGLAQ